MPAEGLSGQRWVWRLDELYDRVRAAGVEIDPQTSGTPRMLPAGADLAAYRIVQECLTNVVKHSVHPRAEVRLGYGADGIVITVTNPDLDPEAHTEGFGITGMRRRATQLGGTLTAGPAGIPHTVRVRAVIPASAGALRTEDEVGS